MIRRLLLLPLVVVLSLGGLVVLNHGDDVGKASSGPAVERHDIRRYCYTIWVGRRPVIRCNK